MAACISVTVAFFPNILGPGQNLNVTASDWKLQSEIKFDSLKCFLLCTDTLNDSILNEWTQ